MFSKEILISMSLMLPFGAAASSEYVRVNIEGKMQEVPKPFFDDAQAKMKALGTALTSCTPTKVTVENPLIERENNIEISTGSTGCSLIYERFGVWQYRCILDRKKRKELGSDWVAQASTDQFLGPWSPTEEKIILNPDHCVQTRM
jgi:hypothetical protein